MMSTHRLRAIFGFLVVACVAGTISAKMFDECKAKVELLANKTNSTIDIFYQGPLRGFDTSKTRPITLTFEGCMEACGDGSQLNDIVKAFSILTTWILPAIALLSQLPYEALSEKKRRNFEAFVNWVGSPVSALATTMYNIYLVQKCLLQVSEVGNERSVARDSYFVLSCINQYEFPGTLDDPERDERDMALYYGLQRPLVAAFRDRKEEEEKKKLKELISHLAFQLRLQRRRGVWPLSISVVWFLVAFCISVVVAFEDLGDNTTAHSLALGLLLSWLPILVVMMIVDRNPVCATRCKVLIERWLYNVDKIRKQNHAVGGASGASQPAVELWGQTSPPSPGGTTVRRNQNTAHSIGEFVGQGRRLRYCGVANAILKRKGQMSRFQLEPNSVDPELQLLRDELVERPWSWWAMVALSFFIITNSFGMAFMVSFRTPTVGLGCRSLLYLIYYLLSLVSFLVLLFRQEPARWLQRFLIIPNTFATLVLILIMGFQLTNGLNNCRCKSSLFGGSNYGGYMDFQNAVFYRNAYGVARYWGSAAGFGLLSPLIAVSWAIIRWVKSTELWRVNEEECPDSTDGIPLKWLT